MSIFFGDTLSIVALLPLTGLFIRIVHCFSSISVHLILIASAVLAAVSFKVCRNAAIFFPQPAMSWSTNSYDGMNGILRSNLVFGFCHWRLQFAAKL
jgi:hypothetical protein